MVTNAELERRLIRVERRVRRLELAVLRYEAEKLHDSDAAWAYVAGRLAPFMLADGWQKRNKSKQWWTFDGPADVDGDPLVLVFPYKALSYSEHINYINKALNLLEAL